MQVVKFKGSFLTATFLGLSMIVAALASCGMRSGSSSLASADSNSSADRSEPGRIKLVDAAIYFKFSKDNSNNDRVISERSNPPAGYLEEPGTAFWLPIDTKYQLGGQVHSSLKLITVLRNDFIEGSHMYTDSSSQADMYKSKGAVNALWVYLFKTDANNGSPLYLFKSELAGRWTIGFEPEKMSPYSFTVDRVLGYVLRK